MEHTPTTAAGGAATKLCECGCGQPAPIAWRTDRRFGLIKGQPQRFIWNHHARRGRKLTREQRAHVLASNEPNVALAARLGVSRQRIWQIRSAA